MTVIPAMLSSPCERHGPFSEGGKLGQVTKESLRGLGYGG
jgi:hypothetical protein